MLGIDTATGNVYEGAASPYFAVWPTPILSAATLIDLPADWNRVPYDLYSAPPPWVFREDSFDPVTRIRRGRLYEPSPDFQNSWPVSAHPYDHEGVREVASSRRLMKQQYGFNPCNKLLERPDRGLGTTIALGFGKSASAWRTILTERIVGNDVLIVLKAFTAFGIVPDIDNSKIGIASRTAVVQAIEHVVNSAFRESPVSVIDHCRDAISAVLSNWVTTQNPSSKSMLGLDLAKIAEVVEKAPYDLVATAQVAKAIARVHPRRKPNEQANKQLRISVEEDAEFALSALGFILREVGWAR
jgi:hypothetical protein